MLYSYIHTLGLDLMTVCCVAEKGSSGVVFGFLSVVDYCKPVCADGVAFQLCNDHTLQVFVGVVFPFHPAVDGQATVSGCASDENVTSCIALLQQNFMLHFAHDTWNKNDKLKVITRSDHTGKIEY